MIWNCVAPGAAGVVYFVEGARIRAGRRSCGLEVTGGGGGGGGSWEVGTTLGGRAGRGCICAAAGGGGCVAVTGGIGGGGVGWADSGREEAPTVGADRFGGG